MYSLIKLHKIPNASFFCIRKFGLSHVCLSDEWFTRCLDEEPFLDVWPYSGAHRSIVNRYLSSGCIAFSGWLSFIPLLALLQPKRGYEYFKNIATNKHIKAWCIILWVAILRALNLGDKAH